MRTVNKSVSRLLLAACFVCCAAAVCAAQGNASVEKVEPPNWWAGHSINPVRVLVRGRNLSGARVEAVGGGIKTGLVRVNEPNAKPGVRQLRIRSGGGTADAPFEINAPLQRQGRFQGFSPDDVIYLIMPDRFADGDTSNDDPPQSRGLYDRSNKFYYHGGDFQGIINHLPYLKELGVTAIWLTPWYDNVNHPDEIEKKEGAATTGFHGYGAVDFYGVEEHFGTLSKLRELVRRRGAQPHGPLSPLG